MIDAFRDPKRRIARAKEHIADLEAGIQAFLQSDPYGCVIDVDPETKQETHIVRLTQPFPDRLLSQAVEISEGLRAALDNAGFAAAEASGNTRLKGTYFPIAETAEKLETDVIGRGRCKDLPVEIVEIFKSFKPHKAGNPLIWAVNQLANGSKHRILIPVGMTVGNSFLGSFYCPGLVIHMEIPPRWDFANDQMKLCVVASGANPQYNMRMEMFVAIKEIEGLPHGPAPAVFGAIAAEVERIVMATEVETERLLLARSA